MKMIENLSRGKRVKKILIVLALLYFTPGFLFGILSYNEKLRTFECLEERAPHGYITMSTPSYINPNSEICSRRGFKIEHIGTVPMAMLLGTPVILHKVFIVLTRL